MSDAPDRPATQARPGASPAAPPAILLMGPTGTGKTDAAVALAERFPLEIVSVDSALVYRGLDVGSAKPDAATLARVPHHLVDIRDPAEPYSAGEFLRDATHAMDEIRTRGRVPLLVGGTMLYFRVLQAGLAELPAADPALRRELDAEAARFGWPALHARLAQVDAAAAARIRPNDAQRIQRALEVWRITGTPLSRLQRQDLRGAAVGDWLKLVLAPADRAVLNERLASRFDRMMERGLLAEVGALRTRGDLDPDCPALRAVGYRQVWMHLDGAWDLAEARARAIQATRQLAKRQLTWLRAEPDAEWFDPFAAGPGVVEKLANRVAEWLRARGRAPGSA
ncbi:MAG: tRNA (adenosine(37)-N6)-dimethylallyltransferase MiaA [Pseudomonadota bacterium]